MKQNYSNIIQKLSFISALFFVFWLPLFEGFMPTIFGIWIGFWLLEGKFKTRFQNFNFKSGLYLSLTTYFLLSILAVFYSSNQDKAWFDVQQKIALVVFPILLAGMSPYFWNNIRWVFWAFIAGLFAATIYDLFQAFQMSYTAGKAEGMFHFWVYERHENEGFLQLINLRMSYFSYGYLSRFMHPSYFSMYLIFGLPVIYHQYKTRLNPKQLDKIAYFFLGLYFIFIIYLLQSTAGFISLALILLIMLIQEIVITRKKRISFYSYGILLSIFILLFVVKLKTNHNSDFATENSEKSLSTSSSIRLEIWKKTYSLWSENPILGTGPSDVRETIKKKFSDLGNKEFATGNFNMHNQFLESLIGLGIIGLITLLSILYFGIRIALTDKRELLIFLMIIILSNLFFESVMNRQSGLFFLLFFLSLLAFNPKSIPSKS
jgi:O-antigen ligase